MGFNPGLSSKLVTQTHLMTWLLKRIQAKSHDENRAYAAELLSILLQSRNENRLVLCENDGIEIILKVLSVILISNQLQNYHTYSSFFFIPKISNFEGGIPWTQRKLNLWKIFSMHYVQFLASQKQNSCSLMRKDLI
jgi:hypothetical protein